jgi:hypothetical protein
LTLESKKPWPNGISPLILKKILMAVKKPLTVLFNLSLHSGVPLLRLEGVRYLVSLFKSGDKRNDLNYRGISFLSAIPKLFEKLVCDVITPIMRPSISDGFVGGRSAVTSLV